MILDLLDKWYKLRFVGAGLRAYEAACLDAWKQRLAGPPRSVVERQLSRFDYVERLQEDKQVNFWCLKEETGRWPAELRLPAGTGKQAVQAATVWLRKPEPKSRARLRADVVVFDGRFFSIEFNKPPLAFLGIDKKNSVEPAVDEVVIHHDLTHGDAPAAPLTDTGHLTVWLAEWHARWQLTEVLEPPPEAERERLLRSFDTVFPEDYLEAAAQVGGFRARNCRLFGLSEVEKIVQPDQSFYIIAEVEDRAYIGVRQGAETVEIFELHFEFEVPELYDSTSIRAVLEREMEAEHD